MTNKFFPERALPECDPPPSALSITHNFCELVGAADGVGSG
jgi:hypothetical protein